MNPIITPVLLCGGSGTRLWPLSRKSYPKQFVPLIDEESLFQSSAKRLSGVTSDFGFGNPIAVTHSDFRFVVTEQLMGAGIDPAAVLLEPEGRNTAPSVLAAALHALDQNPDAILLVAPSDQVIDDTAGLHAAIQHGLAAVAEGHIVTFGVTPTRPETGFGYLELPGKPPADGSAIKLASFSEKPDLDTAKQMLASGNYLWNAGMFLFKAADIVAAFTSHAPAMMDPVGRALKEAQIDLGFLRLAPAPWADAENISIDHAVMEKSDNLAAVPLTLGWSDLGDWNSVWQNAGPDGDGVVASDNATAIDCTNTLLRSEAETLQLVGIGLDNIVAVATQDSVLVAAKDRAQDVKIAVDLLKSKSIPQATQFAKEHRPWGWFESLVVGNRFQVKRIMVKPGGCLSLQSHLHRAEHWIVVEGTARVTIGETVQLVSENESVYVPLGAVHRMENPGKLPMVLIEVQTGAYIGEDDIVRYEDIYDRNTSEA